MIMSYYELAHTLGRNFAAYANRVENGDVAPYMKLLSQGKVDVVFSVTNDGSFTVKELVEPVIEAAPVLEMPIEAVDISEVEKDAVIQDMSGVPTVIVKPKRKRKTE
jgi:hypothetical protein